MSHLIWSKPHEIRGSINVRQIPSMFISSMWDVKEPTHYSKRVRHEVPGVVAVLCEGVSEGDIPRMGL